MVNGLADWHAPCRALSIQVVTGYTGRGCKSTACTMSAGQCAVKNDSPPRSSRRARRRTTCDLWGKTTGKWGCASTPPGGAVKLVWGWTTKTTKFIRKASRSETSRTDSCLCLSHQPRVVFAFPVLRALRVLRGEGSFGMAAPLSWHPPLGGSPPYGSSASCIPRSGVYNTWFGPVPFPSAARAGSGLLP